MSTEKLLIHAKYAEIGPDQSTEPPTAQEFAMLSMNRWKLTFYFWKNKILIHMIDCCIRWTVCKIIPDKKTETILDAIEEHWFSQHEPPAILISDHEGALDSDAARFWADRKGTKIKLKPPGNIGASTVERHHELLRDHLHKIDGTVKEEGPPGIEDRHVLQEAILTKNMFAEYSRCASIS